MGTIANLKNGSMVQLEIQGIGTSETSIMLQQPLLGTSSDGYTVEVTQLMMSLGEERAVSGTEYILGIARRPADGTALNLDAYHIDINNGTSESVAFKKIVEDAGGQLTAIYNIENIKCYSATDFIYVVNNQISIVNQTIAAIHPQAELSLNVSPSGQFAFQPSDVFWENYLLLVGPVLKALSGCGDVLCGSGSNLIPVRTGILTLVAFASLQDSITFHGKINESAWEIFDRRKRIRVDLSIPVGLTLGWKDTTEVKKFSVQEFYIPRGEPRATYEDSGKVTVKQLQMVGTTEFVNGGGKLAIKKLLQGPVQALRLSLILVYDYFDPLKKVWVEKEKQVSMSSGDFFYLKLQFNKETT